MMMKWMIPAAALLLLAGCAGETAPTQKAQQAQIPAARPVEMEQLCRTQAAKRYNADAQTLDVAGVEQFQGSYEMRGNTVRNERFVCSFDPQGRFQHLSMS